MNKYGKRARILRNDAMMNDAEAVVIVWDSISKGTKHTMTAARIRKKQLHIVNMVSFSNNE